MCLFKKTSKKHLGSDKLVSQIWGALLKRWWLVLALLALVFTPLLVLDGNGHSATLFRQTWYLLLILTLGVLVIISVCRTLTDIFNLRKKEEGITWCQIMILFAVLMWLFGFLVIANIQKDSRYYIAVGIAGSVSAWVFQDTIKGVVAFIHLRRHRLLCIDDWIKVPKFQVDGEVKRVTLTTVTVLNWDTTTATIPTSALHADCFINLQKMAEGKTYGRQICKTFLFDIGWFHPLTAEEAARLKQLRKTEESLQYLLEDEIKEGVLNAKLYREYLFHWLMNHPRISQQPFMLVRWMEQNDFGMPLQVFAFLIDGSFAVFEWQQSQIIEKIIESTEWFGLRLYQRPSAFDRKEEAK